MTDLMGQRRFNVAQVIRRVFGTIGRNLPVFTAMALLLSALPNWLGALADTRAIGQIASEGVFTLVGFVTTFVLQAALVHGVAVDMKGRKAVFGDCLATGVRHFLPVLGISILLGVALTVGFVLLIVPGLMMMTAWAVVIPAQVVEDKGVFQSFSRSADLTRGERWRVLALYLFYLLALFLAFGVMASVLGQISGASEPVREAVRAVIEALVAMVGATGGASVYFELRQSKEGAQPEALASVFD